MIRRRGYRCGASRPSGYSAEISRPVRRGPTRVDARPPPGSSNPATSTPRSRSSTATRSPTPSSPSRVQVAGLDPWRLGGEMWGWYADGRLRVALLRRRQPRPRSAPPPRPSAPSPTGPAGPAAAAPPSSAPPSATAAAVAAAGTQLGPGPRGPRPPAADGHRPRCPPSRRPTRYVRRIRKDEMDVIMPACVAMFTEEVGVSPLAGDGGLLYQARVAELVGAGRSFARIEDGKVVFKAEIGAATPQACQIQGVWVAPELPRPRPLRDRHGRRPALRARATSRPSSACTSTTTTPPARAAYRRVGFQRGRRVHERAVLTRRRPFRPSRVRRMQQLPGAVPGPPSVVGRPARSRRPRGRGARRAGARLRPQRGGDRRTPPHRAAPPRPAPAPAPSAPPPPTGRLVGFVYGMPNDRAHWWSTVVEPYLRATGTTTGSTTPSSSPSCTSTPTSSTGHRPRADHHHHRRAPTSPAPSSPPSTPRARPAASTAPSATRTWPGRCSSPARPARTR